MSQYITGSVDVSNGSASVTGNGTNWFTAGISEGDLFMVDGDGVHYTVASIDSENQLSLTAPYAGSTATGLAYVLWIDFTPNRGLPRVSPEDLETWAVLDLVVLELDEVIATVGGGATSLDQLSDVGDAPQTQGYVLIADGATYNGRRLLPGDIDQLLPINRVPHLSGGNVFPITHDDLRQDLKDLIDGGGATIHDPIDDTVSYSTTSFELTSVVASAGQVRSFLATGNTRINVQAGIPSTGNWAFTIKPGSTGEIRSPLTVFVDGVENRGGTGAVLPLAPGFHVLRRLAGANRWEHDGPVVDAKVPFWGPVGGHMIEYGGTTSALSKFDTGKSWDLVGNVTIPSFEGWQAILIASGANRTISHVSFRKSSDGSSVASPYTIAANALMTVLVRGTNCYLLGL